MKWLKHTFLLSLGFFALMIAFNEAVLAGPLRPVLSYFLFYGGYLVNHNPHQPSVVGQAAGAYVFCLLVSSMILGARPVYRLVTRRLRGSQQQRSE